MHNCVICGDEEKEDTPLRQTSCGEHWMCDSCLEETFALALRDESKYHPRCCGEEYAILLISDYQDYLPFELAFDYQVKEREYSIQPRFRVYCGNKTCGCFIHPDNYKQTPVPAALCDTCASLTCRKCKTLIDTEEAHSCVIPESEVKFQEAVNEHKYQRCTCNFVIELTEACNHISCECGRQFCYICGEDWNGYHGCPAYGHPQYDDDGYNQDGFHKDTGLNRNGRTRRQQVEDERFGEDGFDHEGFDRNGFNEEGFDRDGFNAEGVNADGFPRLPDDLMEEHRMALEAQNIALGNFRAEEPDDENSQPSDEESNEDEANDEGEGDATIRAQDLGGEVVPGEEAAPEEEETSEESEEDENDDGEEEDESEGGDGNELQNSGEESTSSQNLESSTQAPSADVLVEQTERTVNIDDDFASSQATAWLHDTNSTTWADNEHASSNAVLSPEPMEIDHGNTSRTDGTCQGRDG